jgi:hypothetical protein
MDLALTNAAIASARQTYSHPTEGEGPLRVRDLTIGIYEHEREPMAVDSIRCDIAL